MFPLNVIAATVHSWVYIAELSGSRTGWDNNLGTEVAGFFPVRDFNMFEITRSNLGLWVLRLQDVGQTTPPPDTDATWADCITRGVFQSGSDSYSFTRSACVYSTQALGTSQWTFSDAGSPVLVDATTYSTQLPT